MEMLLSDVTFFHATLQRVRKKIDCCWKKLHCFEQIRYWQLKYVIQFYT